MRRKVGEEEDDDDDDEDDDDNVVDIGDDDLFRLEETFLEREFVFLDDRFFFLDDKSLGVVVVVVVSNLDGLPQVACKSFLSCCIGVL